VPGKFEMKPWHVTPSIFRPCVVAAVLGFDAIGSPAAAQSPEQDRVASPWIDRVPIPVELKGLPEKPAGLCEDKPGGPAWLERMQASFYRTMCFTAARFDGFFGNAQFDDEYQATHGSIVIGALWDERDRFDPSVRFRVRLHLPQLSERFNAFVGKVNPDEYLTELRDDFATLPRQFARQDDDAVLLGLGYSQPALGGGRFDADVGAELGSPLDPYVKGRYRIALPFLERNVLRLRETIFWQESEGIGATTRFDLERLLMDQFLVRWTGSGTLTQESEGLRWYSSITLYQNLGERRALAYEAGIAGESGQDVEISDYGLRVIYRRRTYRDWLFLELRSSVTWPRESLLERREPNWGAGAGFELLFGERTRT
jgi:hypothetical protein